MGGRPSREFAQSGSTIYHFGRGEMTKPGNRIRQPAKISPGGGCSKPAVTEPSGLVKASPGLPQGNVKNCTFVA
jgi:hypothetical protein